METSQHHTTVSKNNINETRTRTTAANKKAQHDTGEIDGTACSQQSIALRGSFPETRNAPEEAAPPDSILSRRYRTDFETSSRRQAQELRVSYGNKEASNRRKQRSLWLGLAAMVTSRPSPIAIFGFAPHRFRSAQVGGCALFSRVARDTKPSESVRSRVVGTSKNGTTTHEKGRDA